MKKPSSKVKIIEAILLETTSEGETHFFHLNDKSETYLNKLLKVIRAL